MTTFVTVLRRAVEGLEDHSEERTDIYDRAKSALRAQFQHAEPPLPQDEIERQWAELDDAIEQVEAEIARARDVPAEEAVPRSLAEEAAEENSQNHVAADASPVSQSHASFRSAIAETAGLGVAASQAAQAARATYGQFGEVDGVAPDRDFGDAESQQDFAVQEDNAAAPSQDAAGEVAAAFATSDSARATGEPRYDGLPADAFEDDYDGGGRGVSVAMWAIVFLMIAGIAGAAFWQRDALTEVVMSLGEGESEAEVADAVAEPKVDERVPSTASRQEEAVAEAPADAGAAENAPPAEASLPQDAARVAQALLVEEGADNSLSSLGGSVDWALLDDPEAPPEASKVIRATVQVPDKNITLTLAIRRNTDPDLPASHTVELLFDLPRDFENGGVAGVAGLVMKATPQSSGQPLIGAVVPVTDEFYLLGLSESDFDRTRNIDELRRRSFIDIPIAYADESRAILSIAKGESGSEVFAQAFEAWGH